MPFTVSDLTQDNPPLVSTKPDTLVMDALALMNAHDFSQLPVVSQDGVVLGILTNETILSAASKLRAPLEKLRVLDAFSNKAKEFRKDADLFELLDTMRDHYAVLIVDRDRRLQGIVTNYDTTAYFRRSAEDMMLVKDIEDLLKDFIQKSFTNQKGEVDEVKLDRAVQRITDSSESQRKTFIKALKQYLGRSGIAAGQVVLDDNLAEEIYHRIYDRKMTPKSFDDLTMYDYIQLFLDKKRWHRYQRAFSLDRQVILQLLDKVRLLRNALAHFQGDLTEEERESLRFISGWLNRHQLELDRFFVTDAGIQSEVDLEPGEIVDGEKFAVEEELGPDESRYAALAMWLQNQPPELDQVRLKFEQIEAIIKGELPESALNHRSWWGNDTVSHVQSQLWVEAGWRVGEVAMNAQKVRFTRIKERERAYISFFSKLVDEIRSSQTMPVETSSPRGQNYQHLTWTRFAGPRALIFVVAFAAGKRVRVELYIDTRDRTFNKAIFDQLKESRVQIESDFDESFSWERLDSRRACRIAIYRKGSITDEPDTLDDISGWALDLMPRFYQAVNEPARRALQDVTGRELS